LKYFLNGNAGYTHAVPAGENADLGHTTTGQSETCKTDPQIRPANSTNPFKRDNSIQLNSTH